MTDTDPNVTEITVREHPLPGPARFFELVLAGGTVLQIFTESSSSDSHLAVIPPDADTPVANLRLTKAEAITLSSLMSGVTADAAGRWRELHPDPSRMHPDPSRMKENGPIRSTASGIRARWRLYLLHLARGWGSARKNASGASVGPAREIAARYRLPLDGDAS